MKLVTFTHAGSTRIGIVAGDQVVDLAVAAPSLPREMCAFVSAGEEALASARKAATQATSRIALADVRLEAPILRPSKFLAIGLNYADHVAESGMDTPPFPVFFNKQSTCVTVPTIRSTCRASRLCSTTKASSVSSSESGAGTCRAIALTR